jgi:hypothetical protein
MDLCRRRCTWAIDREERSVAEMRIAVTGLDPRQRRSGAVRIRQEVCASCSGRDRYHSYIWNDW